MKSLKQRNVAQGLAQHRLDPVRVYERDSAQSERIRISREWLKNIIRTFPLKHWPLRIVELGCGTADISGPSSPLHEVYGFDCSPKALEVAMRRFPNGSFDEADITTLPPRSCHILVLCETLEHIPDPEHLLRKWLPLAEAALISHPIEGDLEGDLSGGDHQWSFSRADFYRWASLGGHEIVKRDMFPMSKYNIGIQHTRQRGD